MIARGVAFLLVLGSLVPTLEARTTTPSRRALEDHYLEALAMPDQATYVLRPDPDLLKVRFGFYVVPPGATDGLIMTAETAFGEIEGTSARHSLTFRIGPESFSVDGKPLAEVVDPLTPQVFVRNDLERLCFARRAAYRAPHAEAASPIPLPRSLLGGFARRLLKMRRESSSE